MNHIDFIKVNSEICTKCGLCVKVCRGTLVMSNLGPKVDKNLCIACGHCVSVCPNAALDNIRAPLQNQIPIKKEYMIDSDTAAGFLRSRRSVRTFQEKVVPRDTVRELLDIARFAPTACNSQGISYHVIDNPDTFHRISSVIADWAEQAIETGPLCEMFRRTNPYGVIPRQFFAGSVYRMIYLINLARRRAGKHSLVYDRRLSQVAGGKARDMATIGRCPAEHYSPTFGGDEGKMLKDAGITAANFGWIIYCGQPGTYYNAVSWWMNESPPHRERILDSSFNRLGVGTAVSSDGRRYWSVIFSS